MNSDPQDFLENLFLTIFNAICMVMFVWAYCDPKKQILGFIALSVTNLRLILRIAGFGDLHETHYIMWFLLLIINSLGTFFNYSMLATNFKFFKTRNIVISFMFILQFLAFYRSVDVYKRQPEDYSFELYLRQWGVILLFFVFLFWKQ